MKKEQNLKPRKIDPILLRMENENESQKDWTLMAMFALVMLYFVGRLFFQV
jgi:hypothetical protein